MITKPTRALLSFKSPEPTAVGAVGSAVAVHAASRRWLSSRHEVAFGTAWLDWNPDQVLRVAAGIPGKRASGGLPPTSGLLPGVRSLPSNEANLAASSRGSARIGGQGQTTERLQAPLKRQAIRGCSRLEPKGTQSGSGA
jgi:hypothetical protein